MAEPRCSLISQANPNVITTTVSVAQSPGYEIQNVAAGTYTLRVTASGYETQEATVSTADGQTTFWSFWLQKVNTPPSIFGVPQTQAVVNERYIFEPGFTDPDSYDYPLNFTIQNKPDWATFESWTGVISGTPTAVGTAVILLSASAMAGITDTLPAFSIQVVATYSAVNNPPVITHKQGAPEALVGELYYFNPAGFDPDGDALTYEIVNKPAWATFDPKTGILQEIPTANSIGLTDEIIIRAVEAPTTAQCGQTSNFSGQLQCPSK